MSSFRQILYHIIFRTKNSAKTLPLADSEELYRYIWGIVKNKNGTLLRINGMEDHVHILSDLPPIIALADYIRDIKANSSHSTRQVQALVAQINDILEEGGVNLLLNKIDALLALQADTEVARINHGLGQYPIVTVYEYQGGTMGEDGVVTGAALTQVVSSHEFADENNFVLRVKSGYEPGDK